MSTISIAFVLIILLFGFDPQKEIRRRFENSEMSVFESLRKR
jgi:multisubunit Na+/H+ antiporter MnhB subunit